MDIHPSAVSCSRVPVRFVEKSVITSMINYTNYCSYPTVLRTLKSELQRSPQWSPFYKNADNVICRLNT
jgi:hypothetical protein